MAQIFSQIDHDPDSFTITGASSATAVQAARPLVVNYSGGSSDTIPIHTVAVLPDNVTTTFDRSLAVWVIYTVPGSGLLYAVLESQVAGLTGDYAPLIRVMRHDWDWYQPMQPTGSASTFVRASAVGNGKVLDLGVGGTPPATWETAGYDDSAWNASVAQTGDTLGTPLSGSIWVSWTAATVAINDVWLLRDQVVLPSGTITAATLSVWADDIVAASYCNGVSLGSGSGVLVFDVTPDVSAGAAVTIAVEVLNTVNASPTSLDYVLSVSYAGGSEFVAISSPVEGDLAYFHSGAWHRLPVGTTGQLLAVASGDPAWASAISISGEVTASDFKAAGLTGATAASRYVGATTSGAPVSGTFAVGDYVVDRSGTFWICTTAGTPGTWTQVTGGGGGSSTLAGDTDVSISGPVGGQVLGYSSALSKWVNQQTAGVAATTQTAQLGADVALTSANTFYDGPTVTLPPGTWFLGGGVQLTTTSVGNQVTAKLWDGTNAFASAATAIGTSVTDIGDLSLVAIVSPTTTTNYKISCAGTATGNTIKAAAPNNAAGNVGSYLRAIQLSGNPVGQQAPAVRCYNSAAISIPTSAFTALTFDTNRVDQGTSTAQHSTSSNTSRLVCQQAGLYQITGNVLWASNATGQRVLQIRLNGSTNAIASDLGPPSTTFQQAQDITTLYQLAVGDYVELYAYQDSGGAVNVTTTANYSPEFMMARIDSGPGAVQPNTKVQLDYVASTDLMSNTAISATTWTDLTANQPFIVDDANSVVEIAVSGNCFIGANANNIQRESGSRIVIDSAGTPINKMIGGAICPPVSGQTSYANSLSGANVIEVTGLSAGSHTVKVQVYADGASVGYCRASSLPNLEFLTIRVLERKQSVSPPSSTPAPAVRCYNSANISISNNTTTALTFDTNRVDQGTSTAQHSTSSDTGRLTCQQAGMYQIDGMVSYAANATGVRQTQIRLNGSTIIARDHRTGNSAGYSSVVTVSTLYQLAVGDYVELTCYQDSGGALDAEAGTNYSPEFGMARIDTGALPAYTWQTKTSAYTMVTTDYGGILADATGGAFTVTLPTAVGTVNRYTIKKKDSSANAVTVATQSAQTIDGASTYSLSTQNNAVTVESDGTNWYVQSKV